jgi:hypothetical protein
MLNTGMRLHEFARSTLKPIKPMTPAQHRVYSMKRNVDHAKDDLKREKDAQKRRRDLEQQWKKLRTR